MTLESHPLRDVIVSEMHMRRMPPLAAPVTMTQTVRLLAPEERDTERAHIGAMPHVAGEALGIRDRDAAGRAAGVEARKSTRLDSSHSCAARLPSSAGTKKNNNNRYNKS